MAKKKLVKNYNTINCKMTKIMKYFINTLNLYIQQVFLDKI